VAQGEDGDGNISIYCRFGGAKQKGGQLLIMKKRNFQAIIFNILLRRIVNIPNDK
jgi:hypothetical protein